LQQLAKFGHEQQDKLLQRQQQLQQAHDHLVENSKSILEAQVCFFFNLHLLSNPVTCVSSQIVSHLENQFVLCRKLLNKSKQQCFSL
jgi:hypothetical protein